MFYVKVSTDTKIKIILYLAVHSKWPLKIHSNVLQRTTRTYAVIKLTLMFTVQNLNIHRIQDTKCMPNQMQNWDRAAHTKTHWGIIKFLYRTAKNMLNKINSVLN